MKDSFGDSLLHYVAAAMDEDAIFKVGGMGYGFVICLMIMTKYENNEIFTVIRAGYVIMNYFVDYCKV